MPRSLRHLTEAQIRKAEAEGKLRGLEGEGKPLPRREGEGFKDGAMAAGHRIMAEAGVVPEEFRIKAELDAARADLKAAIGTSGEKPAMARVADLEMRYEIARDARRKFQR